MTRVVAGAARGRRLAVPPAGTRPTSDRAREGLFSSLEAAVGSLAGARFADLFAGSGAVGLEALSRGAAHCLLVESDPAAVTVLRRNVAAVGLPGADVVARRVERVVAGPARGPAYDVVFLDPPYDLPDGAVRGIVEGLRRDGWLAAGALVVVERASRGGEWVWPDGVEPVRSRRYGEGTLWYGRAADPAGRAGPVEDPGG